MKELPKVYVSPIDKDLRNNKDMFYSKLLDPKKDTKDIMREIDKIFHSRKNACLTVMNMQRQNFQKQT